MNVAFVVTNYNNTEFTRQLLESLAKIARIEECAAVVVDNSSNSGERRALEALEGEFGFLRVIYNDANIGYFRGLNVGLQAVRKDRPDIDYIVVGNNDLVFDVNFLDSLAPNGDLFRKYPVIAPDIVTMDGVHQNPHVIAPTGWIRECIYDLYYANYQLSRSISGLARLLPFTDRKDELQHEKPMEIHQGYGACYLLTPLFFKHFDQLWAPTFLMGEEYFLSLQLEKEGLTTYYEPSIKVVHCEHASTSRIPAKSMWEIARESHRVYRQHKKRFS